MIDVHDFGYVDAKLQSCKTARPGMKISGKEDTAIMDLVTVWWQEELAEERCWADGCARATEGAGSLWELTGW
jgi:hypothetical protein